MAISLQNNIKEITAKDKNKKFQIFYCTNENKYSIEMDKYSIEGVRSNILRACFNSWVYCLQQKLD